MLKTYIDHWYTIKEFESVVIAEMLKTGHLTDTDMSMFESVVIAEMLKTSQLQ